MAHHVHGYPSGPSGIPPPIPTTGTRYSRTPIGSPDVKEELCSSGEYNNGTPLAASNRSHKRRKIEEDSKSSHKFVSQKKWKFSDGQPWLPSKLSSKAQNASKASQKNKIEPASPKRSSSPVVLSSTQAFTPTQAHTQLNSENIAIFRGPMLKTDTQSLRSPSCSSETPDIRHTTRENVLRLDNLSSKTKGNQVAESPTTLASQIEGIVIQPGAETSHRSMSPLAIAASSVPGRSKSARSTKALSLEKDAERIAALIAEKRKENESSMFRERILQRRREQNYRDTEDDSAGASPTIQNSPSNTPQNVQTSAACSKQNSLSIEPSTSNLPNPPKLVTKTKPQVRQYEQNALSKPSSTAVTDKDLRSSSAVRDAGKERLALSPNNVEVATRPSSERDGYVNLFRDQSSHRPPSKHGGDILRSTIVSSAPANKFQKAIQNPDSEVSVNRSMSSSTHSKLVHETQAQKAEQTGRDQQARNLQSDGQIRHTPQNIYPQTIRQSPTATTYNERHPVERVAQSLPSSTNFMSSQSLTTIPVHHFSQIEVSPQSYQHNSMYRNDLVQRQYPSNGQIPINPSMYYTSGQMHVPADQRHLGQFNMGNQMAYRTSMPMQNVTGAQQAPPPATSQHPPQQRVTSSNTNMFSGGARSGAGNGMGVVAPKPRVNMFSNTKGTPFPVHEVIRQIEMT